MYAHDKIGCMALEGPRKKYPGLMKNNPNKMNSQ